MVMGPPWSHNGVLFTTKRARTKLKSTLTRHRSQETPEATRQHDVCSVPLEESYKSARPPRKLSPDTV